MSRKAMQVALEALESDPISYAGPVTVLSPGKGTGCGYTNINENWTHFYTAPPKKEWVGLTDDEVSEIIDREIGFNSCWGPEEAFARAVEQALKEKNT